MTNYENVYGFKREGNPHKNLCKKTYIWGKLSGGVKP